MPPPSQLSIAPANIRYIKLGAGGRWETASLDGGRIDWGHADDPHTLALAGDWDGARQHYQDIGMTGAGNISDVVRSLKDFYTLGADTLWVTIARDRLWWAFAAPEVVDRGPQTLAEASRYRRTLAPWRCTDIAGEVLDIHALSTQLTQVASYRRTICRVGAEAYLLRRINADVEPAVATATAARQALVEAVAPIIRQLHWADFELLADLVFAQGGWRRVSRLGGSMKDHDLLIEQPVTGERASVQVKSKADQRVLDACLAVFENSPISRFFFVCHSAAGDLQIPAASADRAAIWGVDRLAKAAVDGGLVDWLIARAGLDLVRSP